MAITKLWPARQQMDIQPVVDLDSLIAEPKAFRWRGKNYVIRPIDTLTFLKVTDKMTRIQELIKSNEKIDNKTVIEAYADVFSSVCPEITKHHVLEMTQAQVGALFQLIVDVVTGRAQKKTQVMTQATST